MNDHPSSKQASGSRGSDASSIIELVKDGDPVDPAEDRDIIELTDIVEGSEDVIELTDIVDPDLPYPHGTSLPAEETTGNEAGYRMQVEAALETAPDPEDLGSFDADLDFGDLRFSEADLEESASGVFTDALAMGLDADIEPPLEDSEVLDFPVGARELSEAIDRIEAQGPTETPADEAALTRLLERTLTPERIESVVERILRHRFAEKIDQLIDAAIERTVNSEIDQLKARLLGYGDAKD
ncbi:MAG: hypothetical protein ACOWWM_09055 [Desulfobacterales bacterium]